MKSIWGACRLASTQKVSFVRRAAVQAKDFFLILRKERVPLEIRRDDFTRLSETQPSLGVKVILSLAELTAVRLRHSDENVI